MTSRIDIPIENQTAIQADMHANRPTFWNNAPAPAARLGGMGRAYGDDLSTGALSLVFKHLPGQPKACVMQGQQPAQFVSDFTHQNFVTVLGTPDPVIFQGVNPSCAAAIPCVTHGTSAPQDSMMINDLILERSQRASSAA